MSLYPIQPSFAGGELSPSLWGRVDLNKYAVGLRTLENFIVHPHGGVSRRPGMRYVAAAKGGKCRLVTFQYNLEQSYVLEFGSGYIRFFKDGAPVLSGGVPYEVATPYGVNDLAGLAFTQSADVLFICHSRYQPRELSRYSDTNWSLSKFAFKNGPFKVKTEGQETVTLGVSAATGSVTMTSSLALFQAGHVGSLWSITHQVAEESAKGVPDSGGTLTVKVYKAWRLETNGFWHGTFSLQRWDKDESAWVTMKTYTSPNSAKSAKNYSDSGEFDEPTMIRLYSADFTTFVPTDNTEADRGYVLLCANETMHTGYLKITAVANSMAATATVLTDLAKTAATVNWAEGSWSDVQGWPRSVGFYQERICFASTTKEPQTVWMSKTGDYYNFGVSSPVVDDDAISATLAARQVSAIRSFVPLSDLILLTSGSEWKMSAGSKADVVSPTAITVSPQGYRGTAEIAPIIVGNTILFVQAQGARLRDLGYNFESDSYTGNDLTVMATHLFRGHGIVDMAYQQEPDSVCWVARDDGALISLTYLREHDVIAWGRHPTTGTVESITSISEPTGDDVYLVTLRNGVRCIEMMESLTCTDAVEAFYLDSGTTVRNASGVSSVTGLSRLNGLTVSVLADGSMRNNVVVSGGSVAISPSAKVVHVGLPFESKLETLDLNVQRNDGAQLTRKVRVGAVAIRVENTRGLWAGTDADHLLEQFDRGSENYNTPTALATTDYHLTLDSRYDSGRVVLLCRGALPASVLAIVPEVDLGG